MSFNYQREETPKLAAGNYRVVIVSAEQRTSKSGKQMIVLGIRPSGTKITIYHYIVEGEYFNRNMTSFFDSFDVDEGNFELVTWIGAEGAARLAEDENGYLKVKYFIRKDKAANLPPFVGEKPERQTVTKFEDLPSDDDLPF